LGNHDKFKNALAELIVAQCRRSGADQLLDKFEIAQSLREIGALLELKGENSFKVKAYQNGAEAIENLAEELGQLVDKRQLTEIRGIGDALAAKIAELYLTGRCAVLENLRAELPPGVIELSQIPGLSTKKIQALHSALNITSIDELRHACMSGLVSSVPGFGKKTEQKILEGIESYENRVERILLLDAQEIAERIKSTMRRAGLVELETAGSLRRWQETIGDINLVASTKTAGEKALDTFENHPAVTRIEQRNEDSVRVRLASGTKANLVVSSPANFPFAMLAQTGSTAHWQRLRDIAASKGFELSEKGLLRGGNSVPVKSEAEIYSHLDLPYIPPELREDVGEIEEAQNGARFDDLIEIDQLQGMIHCHTTYSDGRNSIEEMAVAAEKMGMSYITITDHSPAAHYAGGVEIDRLKRQWEEIARVQEKVKIKLLRGTESDILEDGALDYPDSVLDHLDIVIASIHSRMKMDEEQMTKRLISCMKRPHFKVWGHALGRLVLRRDPIKCNVEEVLDAAAESRVAIEINGDPYRLDMEPRWLRAARQRGLKFVISVDAHSIGNLYNLPYGVHMARRGFVRTAEVLNARAVTEFIRHVRPQ
jgi:DNA polymerase (family 10)